MKEQQGNWSWNGWDVAWKKSGNDNPAVVFIHGFGASKDHWRHNLPFLSTFASCYALDLIGFGNSSQPKARLIGEPKCEGDFVYCFDGWGEQVADFCREIVQEKVLLVGNSIGGVVALRAALILQDYCSGVVLIDCAQRTMDDKRLSEQPIIMQMLRPLLKKAVRQRWLSTTLFRNAAQRVVIKEVLKKAYPTGVNVDERLVELLYKPSNRPGASEAFRGFINMFDDYLAPNIFPSLNLPVDLIWGEADPWEPVIEARHWAEFFPCIRSLRIIPEVGHCPHDEAPEKVNDFLLEVIQQAT